MQIAVAAGAVAIVLGVGLMPLARGRVAAAHAQAASDEMPTFQVDPFWPRLPNETWMLGEVSGVAVDSLDHVWVLQRPRSLNDDEKYAAVNPPQADCCIPAPPVLEFDADGKFLQGWGGAAQNREWPEREHGITVDRQRHVWITGNGPNDHHILKFTSGGKLVMQIGQSGKSKGSLDTANVNRAAGLHLFPKTNELFVSDGYANRRVIVFDAANGAFKRFWGAYGTRPDDAAPRDRVFEGPAPRQFNIAHAVRVSDDGRVYVADRLNNRIQVFTMDGTYVDEVFIARKTLVSTGVTDGIGFSADPQQRFLYVADGPNSHIWILERKTLRVLGKFGRRGRYAGQWHYLHAMAVDSKGNIYTGEGIGGRRAQKFVFKGLSSTPLS
jgi:hypothetical protein